MEILTGKIGSGKTAALIRHAYMNNATIVTLSYKNIQHILELCKNMESATGINYTSLDVITFDCLIKNKDKNKRYFVDNLDYCLQEFFNISGFNVDGESVIVLDRNYETQIFSEHNLFD